MQMQSVKATAPLAAPPAPPLATAPPRPQQAGEDGAPPPAKRTKPRRQKQEPPLVTSSLLFSGFCRRDQVEAELGRVMAAALANRLQWKPRKTIAKGRRRPPSSAAPKPAWNAVQRPAGPKKEVSRTTIVKPSRPAHKASALKQLLLTQKHDRGARTELRKTHLLDVIDKLKK
jgi:hypothetical protein